MRALAFLSVVLWYVLLTMSPAHAYLDPGNGSLVLQLVLGGLAGALALLRAAWEHCKHRLFQHSPRAK